MRRRLALVAIALAASTSCNNDSGPAPVPDAPQLSCSGPITVDNVTGITQDVSYGPPVTSGGAPPVLIACIPPSGSPFPLGETLVTCTASDALSRQAMCAFTVTLRHKPLAISRVLAFGDSMTEGENGRPVNFVPFVDTPNAYPTILQQLFSERIPSQQITVFNAGMGGEKVTENDDRLKGRIAARQPQVLLLMEGINDLLADLSVATIAAALSDNIRTAHDRGVQYVFVATLPPQAPENCLPPPNPRCRGNDVPQAKLAEVNQRIRGLVPAGSGFLVEVHDLIFPNRTQYIDSDGLHFRPEGNRALANIFWNRIVEVIPSAQLTGSPAISLH